MRTRTAEEKLKDAIFGEGNRLMETVGELSPEQENLLALIERKIDEIRAAFEEAQRPLGLQQRRAIVAFVFERLKEAARKPQPSS